MIHTNRRVAALRERLASEGLPALIVSNGTNMRYLTGFTGEAIAVVADQVVLVTDGRYALRAEDECPHLRIVVRSDGLNAELAKLLSELGLRKAGFEADYLTVAAFEDLQDKLDGVELMSTKGIVPSQRAKKDEGEIAKLRSAVAISDQCYEELKGSLRPGVTEKELARRIEDDLLRLGADKPGFDVIAAFGCHAADPHAEPTDRQLAAGDIVKLDFGARLDGYHSDMTRTLFAGEPDAKQREVYALVAEAQRKAIQAAAPHITGQALDAVARDFLTEAGYGDEFVHGLGHGVGLEIHESPRLGKTSEDVLEPGMVVTIEPGVYIEDWGGVRLEDMVLITAHGCEVLTQASKYVLDE